MEPVTAVLGQHQRESEWEHRQLFDDLQRWVGIFEAEFTLQVDDVALRVDRLPSDRLGHYHVGRNGFGLRGEVALNLIYISPERFWRVLGTLLHELVHAWQHVHGYPSKRDAHNQDFRQKLGSLGLIFTDVGTRFPGPSPFRTLLARNGISVPDEPVLWLPQRVGTRVRAGSLPTWSCACTMVRVNPLYHDLYAKCLKCDQPFTLNVARPTARVIKEC